MAAVDDFLNFLGSLGNSNSNNDAAFNNYLSQINNAYNNSLQGLTTTGAPGLDYSNAVGIMGAGPSARQPTLSGANDIMSWLKDLGSQTGFMPNVSSINTSGGMTGILNSILGAGNGAMTDIGFSDIQKALNDYANQYGFAPTISSLNTSGGLGGILNQINGATPNYGQATTNEQKMLSDLVMNAAKGFADPFTYLAKDQTLANSSFLGPILRNALQAATGRTSQSLASSPNLTNTQLAGDIANTFTGGSVAPQTANFLNTIFGQSQTGSAGGGISNAGPLAGVNPGFQTSAQQYSLLSPTAQSAYQDLASMGPNGQTSQDFLSQLKAGAPAFASAPAASLQKTAGF